MSVWVNHVQRLTKEGVWWKWQWFPGNLYSFWSKKLSLRILIYLLKILQICNEPTTKPQIMNISVFGLCSIQHSVSRFKQDGENMVPHSLGECNNSLELNDVEISLLQKPTSSPPAVLKNGFTVWGHGKLHEATECFWCMARFLHISL